MMRLTRIGALLLLLQPMDGWSQYASTSPAGCDRPEIHAFDFLHGHWEGREVRVSGGDTTVMSVSDIRVTRLLGGCALQEHWTVREPSGARIFDASVIRAFDRELAVWRLQYVDTLLNFQIYDGRFEEGLWRFHRERLEEGRPLLIRVTWEPGESAFTQVIERSRDAGRSWEEASRISYVRAAHD